MGASPPDPPKQGIQNYVLFGDLEIWRSEILLFWKGPYQAKVYAHVHKFPMQKNAPNGKKISYWLNQPDLAQN